jgi:hypothetical protein
VRVPPWCRRRYSYNYGGVHFVSCNTETDWPGAAEENTGDGDIFAAGHFGADGEYLAWLEADLKQAAADVASGVRPWIIAGGHRPYGEIEKSHGPLFTKYGVDVYLAGHVHSYVRSSPVATTLATGVAQSNGSGTSDELRTTIDTRQSKNHYHNAAGCTYIVVGGPGCDEMAEGNAAGAQQAEVDVDPQGRFGPPLGVASDGYAAPLGSSEVATARYAAGVLNYYNTSAVQWRLIDSKNGALLDHVWFTKS